MSVGVEIGMIDEKISLIVAIKCDKGHFYEIIWDDFYEKALMCVSKFEWFDKESIKNS